MSWREHGGPGARRGPGRLPGGGPVCSGEVLMSDTVPGVARRRLPGRCALVAVHRPLGDYMARVFSDTRHWRVERVALPGGAGSTRTPTSGGRRTCAACSPSRSSRAAALRAAAAAAAPAVVARVSRRCTAALAWNTAVSFVTNTNWQSYSGESTMGHLVQMAGLAVQNFVSAAVGIGGGGRAGPRASPAARPTGVGNFWVDLVRRLPADPAAAVRVGPRSC